MPKKDTKEGKASHFEKYFTDKGRAIGKAEGRIKGREAGEADGCIEGEARTAVKFIRERRNRTITDSQILKALMFDFELDEETAKKYMEAEKTNTKGPITKNYDPTQEPLYNLAEQLRLLEQACTFRGKSEGWNMGWPQGLAEGWTNGLAEGEAQAILKYIKNRRKRRIPDSLILKDLLSVFELDETQAKQYMESK